VVKTKETSEKKQKFNNLYGNVYLLAGGESAEPDETGTVPEREDNL
jgi:hypothetical protein